MCSKINPSTLCKICSIFLCSSLPSVVLFLDCFSSSFVFSRFGVCPIHLSRRDFSRCFLSEWLSIGPCFPSILLVPNLCHSLVNVYYFTSIRFPSNVIDSEGKSVELLSVFFTRCSMSLFSDVEKLSFGTLGFTRDYRHKIRPLNPERREICAVGSDLTVMSDIPL